MMTMLDDKASLGYSTSGASEFLTKPVDRCQACSTNVIRKLRRPRRRPLRVLVVEDDADSRPPAAASNTFEREGWDRRRSAENGKVGTDGDRSGGTGRPR